MTERRDALLVIGPEPPPETGMEIATRALLAELRRAAIPYMRVDTADANDRLGNRGRWTVRNVLVAARNIVGAVRQSFRRDVAAVYVPIAQEFPALARDIAFLLIARAARLPAIVHLHGGAFARFYRSRPPATRAVLRRTVGNAARGIVLTEQLRPALECVLPPERVYVVENGIDAPGFDRRSSPEATLDVLFLSSLFRWKGPLVFVDAIARARRLCPQLRGTVAGDWPTDGTQSEMLELAHRLELDDVVSFTGAVDHDAKTELFRAADIFCFASLVPEGQPLVIIEAMAAALPVVAPAWPGIADTVVDGETGLLVPAASAEALAEKLVYLAEHADERRRMGAAGRRRYEELYTQHAFGERMVAVLRPLLEGAAR